MANNDVDVIVRGEGDIVAVNLAKAIRDNQPLSGVKGISYKAQGSVVNTLPADIISDLDSLPHLPWELIDVGAILAKYQKPILQVVTGRGCLMECGFCAQKILYPGKSHRMFSAKFIFDTIEPIINKFNIKYVIFYEGTTINSIQRTRELCEEILHRGLDIYWEASCRANVFPYFGKDIYDLLEKSGCYKLNFGFESGSQRILNLINKKERIRDILKTISIARRYFAIEAYFIYDFPFEKLINALKTLFLMCWIKIRHSRARLCGRCYAPYPGTKLYNDYGCLDTPRSAYSKTRSAIIRKMLRTAEYLLNLRDT